jgi:hypothetical protein
VNSGAAATGLPSGVFRQRDLARRVRGHMGGQPQRDRLRERYVSFLSALGWCEHQPGPDDPHLAADMNDAVQKIDGRDLPREPPDQGVYYCGRENSHSSAS